MKIFILLVLILFSACKSHQATEAVIDPWHGTFLHTSGEFTLVLNHFDKEAVAIDIFEKGKKDSRNSFFGDIKGSSVLVKDRTDPNCNFIFQTINSGVEISERCHGTGEIDGLYKRIGDKI
jgi:hypothetical protein